MKDRRGNTTTYTREPVTGRITRVSFPDAGEPNAGGSSSFRTYAYQVDAPGGPVSGDRTYVYNPAPYYLLSSTDERGNTTTIQRDPANHLPSQINYPSPDGGYESLTYQAFTYNGNTFYQVATRRTVLGAMLTFGYDSPNHGGSGLPGLLTSVTRPKGDSNNDTITVNYYYDAYDRLIATLDERNHYAYVGDNTGQGGYNGRQQVVRATQADGSPVTFAYDDYGNQTVVTDALGHPTTTAYDDYRRPVSVVVQLNDPVSGILSRTTTMSYERLTASTTTTPPNRLALSTALQHTSATWGTLALPSGKAAQRVYTPNELPSGDWQGLTATGGATGTVTGGPDTTATVYGYDPNDNLATLVQPPAGNGMTQTTSYTYDTRDRLKTQTAPTANTSGSSAGVVTTYSYDRANNLVRVDLPADNQSDPAHRPILYAAPDPADPNDPANVLNYDRLNRRRSTKDPKGQTTKLTYDAAGNVLTLTDGRNYSTFFTYDLLGRRRTSTYPAGGGESWTYDEAGNTMTYTNRAGAVQTFSAYDVNNRPTGYGWSGTPAGSIQAPAVTMAFDSLGRLTALGNDASQLTYDFNDANEVVREHQGVAGSAAATVSYNLDPDGLAKELTYPSNLVVKRQFDSRSRLKQLNLNSESAALATFGWNGDDTAATRDLGNATHATWSYDGKGRVKGSTHTGPGSPSTISQREYGFNPSGELSYFRRIAEKPASISYYKYPGTGNLSKGTSTAAGTGDACFYDPAGQLTGIYQDAPAPQGGSAGNGDLYAGVPASARHTHAWAYDAAGNRASATFDSATTSYALDGLNRYTLTTNDDGSVTSYFTYDAMSNTTGQLGWTYTYDTEGRLRSAHGVQHQSVGGATVTHDLTWSYDALGRCCQRTLDGAATFMFYDGWDLIEERTGVTSYAYMHGPGVDDMVCRVDGASPYGNRLFYHHDGLGNVTHLTDASGAVVESYRYMPFGRPEVFDASGNQLLNDVGDATSAYNNRFLFSGREYIERPELYDLRNRYYSPETGRLLQPDPAGYAGSGVNLYAYCGNDPVNKRDPYGLCTNTGTGSFTGDNRALNVTILGPGGNIDFGGRTASAPSESASGNSGNAVMMGYVNTNIDRVVILGDSEPFRFTLDSSNGFLFDNQSIARFTLGIGPAVSSFFGKVLNLLAGPPNPRIISETGYEREETFYGGTVGPGGGINMGAAKAASGLSFGRKLDFLFNKGIDQSNTYNAARAAGNAARVGIADTAANRAEVTRLFNQAYQNPSSIVGPGSFPGSNLREFFLPGITGAGSKIQFVENGGQVITIIAK